MENKRNFIERGAHKGKGMAVFTSGGDSQGIFIYFIKLPLLIFSPIPFNFAGRNECCCPCLCQDGSISGREGLFYQGRVSGNDWWRSKYCRGYLVCSFLNYSQGSLAFLYIMSFFYICLMFNLLSLMSREVL